MTTYFSAWQAVESRIQQALAANGRPTGSARLLAVSKTFPAEAVAEVYRYGQRSFGENYVQEMVDKAKLLNALDIEWHFIGPLQSNKTRPVAEVASWVHGIDRLKIAERLSVQRGNSLPPLNVCIQVNVSGESSKSGVSPEALFELAQQVVALPNLVLRGLMCIPEPTDDQAKLRSQFHLLAALRDALQQEGITLDTLSMGMSADLELAIAEGATWVRVGSAIFGARHYA